MTNRFIALTEGSRALKIQELILKAIAGELRWYQAAEIAGISERHMRRLKIRYEEYGCRGLFDGRKRPSLKRIRYETAHHVLQLYQREYRGFNVRHFHEELTEERDISVSYTWTKNLLQEAGLVAKAKKRGTYRRRRERKPMTGMMVHLDGSEHRWFEHDSDERQCLIVALDDGNSEVVGAAFFRSESTASCLEVIKEVVETKGTFARLYTDRASHFVHTPVAGEPPSRASRSQVEQVLDELGIELVVAHSPEARGRSERMFGTLQGRLPLELRRAGVKTYADANRFLKDGYWTRHNRRFMVEPADSMTAYLPAKGVDLNLIFSSRFERTVQRDNTVHVQRIIYQLPKVEGRATLAGRKVTLRKLLDGSTAVTIGRRTIARWPPKPKPHSPSTRDYDDNDCEGLIEATGHFTC